MLLDIYKLGISLNTIHQNIYSILYLSPMRTIRLLKWLLRVWTTYDSKQNINGPFIFHDALSPSTCV